MATKKKAPEKAVDLPPHGSRNADPLTDSPGSHPIETGIGAIVGGAASGLAVGSVGGPVGAVVGAIVGGAAAGGLAGKGVGELIDPTTEDNWIRDYYAAEKNKPAGATADTYRPAVRYGLEGQRAHAGRSFDEAEADLRGGWEREHASTTGLGWDHARGAVKHAFDQTIRLHEERLNVSKERVQTGEVGVRKEVHTERRQVTVPVEREEVVIERRKVVGHVPAGAIDARAEEIRIPVREEKVHVTKEAVVTEEVSVGKRKVTDQKTVTGDVRREELKVEETGNVNVKGGKGKKKS